MQKKLFCKIITAITILWPFLNVYGTPIDGFGFGDLMMVLFLPFLLASLFKTTIIINKTIISLFLFYTFSVVVTIINSVVLGFHLSPMMIRLLVESFYVFFVLVISQGCFFDYSFGVLLYKRISVLFSCLLILQFLLHHFFHYDLFLLLHNLKYNQSTIPDFKSYVSKYETMFRYSFRPTSVFLEPAHFAAYVCPALLLTLFNKRDLKIEWTFALIISFAVILSTAGTGYVYLSFIWFAFFYYYFCNKGMSLKGLIFLCLLFLIFLKVVSSISYFGVLLDRIRDIGSGSSSSVNVRLLRGFDVFHFFPERIKVFGIGCGNMTSYILENQSTFQGSTYEYMSSISYVLCSLGYVGFFVFLLFLIMLYRHNRNICNYCGKTLSILLILMYLMNSVLFSPTDSLILMLLLSKKVKCMKLVQENVFISLTPLNKH